MKKPTMKAGIMLRYLSGSWMLYMLFFLILIYTFTMRVTTQAKLVVILDENQESFTPYVDSVIDRQKQQTLARKIAALNVEPKMQIPAHLAEIGEQLLPDDAVILVQIHNRPEYLLHLIDSLRHTAYIDRALLIFSHDVYSDAINTIVSQVDFARHIQIFFPYSLQLYPEQFPGQSPAECPRQISRFRALLTKCINANFPDIYGHYREARFTAVKHHWWWKANRVLNGLECTRNHSGPFVFVEEDHFVSPDFLHSLKQLRSARDAHCPLCGLLSMGTYTKNNNYRENAATAIVSDWVSSQHNMGMVLERSAWRVFDQCAHFFCTHDDYNWDWTLHNLLRSDCLGKRPMQVLTAAAPRIFHIGECGLHHRASGCDRFAMLYEVKTTLKSAAPFLFTDGFRKLITRRQRSIKTKPNGGWGDPRDHQLCLTFSDKVL